MIRRLIILLLIVGCAKDSNNSIASPTPLPPLFENSIVSTEIDFIRESDPDAFISITYKGQDEKEMPDRRNDILFDTNTYVFEASFSNGKIVEIWAHSSFGDENIAQEFADKLTSRLGKLPEFMRDKLSHVVIHKGDATAFSEHLGHFFVLYSDNMNTRIINNDLEETVFHESVHATLDADHREQQGWINAQKRDNNFITEYAQDNPETEDLAESAIFIYTMLKYPARLSEDVEDWVNTHIPNRFEYVRSMFE